MTFFNKNESNNYHAPLLQKTILEKLLSLFEDRTAIFIANSKM